MAPELPAVMVVVADEPVVRLPLIRMLSLELPVVFNVMLPALAVTLPVLLSVSVPTEVRLTLPVGGVGGGMLVSVVPAVRLIPSEGLVMLPFLGTEPVAVLVTLPEATMV